MKNQKSLKDIKISLVGAHTKSLDEALRKRNYNTNLLPTTHFPSFKKIKDSEIVLKVDESSNQSRDMTE